MCRVKGCTDQHAVHFCKVCKTKDVDHFSSKCSKASNNNGWWGFGNNTNYNHCKVSTCQENHNSHYCIVCKTDNVDHFASKCPNGEFFYHGTTIANAQSISKSNIQPSKDGCLGPGIYFTKNFEQAKKIALDRGNGKGAVLTCVAYNDNNGKYMKNRMHTPWCGISYDFKQFCAQDNTRLRLVNVKHV